MPSKSQKRHDTSCFLLNLICALSTFLHINPFVQHVHRNDCTSERTSKVPPLTAPCQFLRFQPLLGAQFLMGLHPFCASILLFYFLPSGFSSAKDDTPAELLGVDILVASLNKWRYELMNKYFFLLSFRQIIQGSCQYIII